MQGNVLPEEAYAGARLSVAEMLLGGTTTFLESLWAERYGFDQLVKAVEESGIRGCLGKVVMDVNPDQPAFRNRMHKGLVEGSESLENAIKMWERFDGAADGRVNVWFGARTPGGVSTPFLTKMCAEAKARNIHITMHCLEEEMDREVFAQFNKSPMEYCDSIGLLSDRTVLIHMCWVEGEDIGRLSRTGTHIAHCPASNMKLGSGFCPVPQLLMEGVNVGIGCDGAPCNNMLDLFQEMRLAAMIHKGSTRDPKVVSAEEALEMATIHGAKALGLDGKGGIGSLEVGKKADFVGIPLKRAHQVPNYDPVATVVYATNAGDVSLVVIDGRVVVENGILQTMDEDQVMKEGIAAGKAVIKLEVGKKADFVGIPLKRAHQVPNYDPVATVVYATNAGDVSLVVIDGRVVVENGILQTMDEDQVMKEGIAAGKAVIKRAGLETTIVPKWPVITN